MMNKQESLGWGVLCSLIGGLIVALLVYWLVLKKKKVKEVYFVAGYFLITLILFFIVGTVAVFGVLGGAFA